jgi:drug/metabolite transporter (DMT)-like permease
MPPTSQSRAELALAGTTFIWGGTFAVVKLGMQDISPILLIAIRFWIAVLVLLLLARRKIFPLPPHTVPRGVLLGLFLFLGFVAQNIGLTITTASKSAFITGMMVLFVPMLQFVIERRAPRLGNVLGVGIVAGGLWLLTSPEGSSFNSGDALTLVCSILFAIYIVYLDVVSREMSAEQLTFCQLSSIAVFSVVAVLLFETPRCVVTAQSMLAMGYLTFLATLFTTWVQTRYQKETTPTRAVVIFSVEPVIASIIAYALLGETLGTMGMVGGVLILAGVLISELSDTLPLLNRSLDRAEP